MDSRLSEDQPKKSKRQLHQSKQQQMNPYCLPKVLPSVISVASMRIVATKNANLIIPCGQEAYAFLLQRGSAHSKLAEISISSGLMRQHFLSQGNKSTFSTTDPSKEPKLWHYSNLCEKWQTYPRKRSRRLLNLNSQQSIWDKSCSKKNLSLRIISLK